MCSGIYSLAQIHISFNSVRKRKIRSNCFFIVHTLLFSNVNKKCEKGAFRRTVNTL